MYRVLLVDDEAVILSGLRNLIDWEELGLETPASAASASEALAMLKANSYDILLTDVRMPGMTGLEMIAKVRERDVQIKILVISGFDDFEYLKIAFQYGIENYLLKPVDEEELTTTLLYTVEKIESEQERLRLRQMMDSIVLDNVLNSWMLLSQDKSAIQERLELLQIRQDRKYYLACVVRVERLEQMNSSVTLNSRQIQRVFQGLCSEDENVYATFSLNGDLLLAYASECRPHSGSLPGFFTIAIQFWLGKSGASWFAGVGRTVEDPMQLHDSYQNAMDLIVYSTIFPQKNMVVGELQEARTRKLFQQLEMEEVWLHCLLHADEEEIIRRLAVLRQHISPLEESDACIQDQALGDILYHIFSSAQRTRNRNRKNKPAEIDFQQIFAVETLSQKMDLFSELVIDFTRKNPCGEESVHPIVTRVLGCIAENYSQELSLKTLAAQYNVSQTYLGRIFKKDTYSLFTEYLCNFRIEKAKELLVSTTMKSADIARQTGFSNPNYFSNVFKKRVGVYPTLFRQQHVNIPPQ